METTSKSGLELTSIVAPNNRPHHRWCSDEQVRDPAPAARRRATSNAHDIVPPRLHDVVEEHLQRWKPRAPQQINRTSSPPLALAESQAHSLSIQDLRQGAQYARHRAWHADEHSDRDFDFDVAEPSAFEPLFDVVIGPEDRVEEALQVKNEKPENE